MPSMFDREGGQRWPRSQRFEISAKGREAEEKYGELIAASRAEEGRKSFDAARDAWASAWSMQPADGLYLGELKAAPRTLEELDLALRDCGVTRREIKGGIERLMTAGLVRAHVPLVGMPLR